VFQQGGTDAKRVFVCVCNKSVQRTASTGRKSRELTNHYPKDDNLSDKRQQKKGKTACCIIMVRGFNNSSLIFAAVEVKIL
jgi:hypothetical protein